jgi:hypothetical protein
VKPHGQLVGAKAEASNKPAAQNYEAIIDGLLSEDEALAETFFDKRFE